MFQMMIYSNEVDGETLTFKYYNFETNSVFCLSETSEFNSNMIIGDVTSPFVFLFPSDWLYVEELPNNFKITSIYPNPFNPSVNIEFEIDKPSNIVFKFYDIQGRQVDMIDFGFAHQGLFDISWSPNLPSGNYFILMIDGESFYREKVTLIK